MAKKCEKLGSIGYLFSIKLRGHEYHRRQNQERGKKCIGLWAGGSTNGQAKMVQNSFRKVPKWTEPCRSSSY